MRIDVRRAEDAQAERGRELGGNVDAIMSRKRDIARVELAQEAEDEAVARGRSPQSLG
jgi:hypothetical protein